MVAGAAVLTVVVFAQGGPHQAAPTPATRSSARTQEPEVAVRPAPARRQPLSYYTGGVRSDLFSAPLPPPPPTPAAAVKPPVAPTLPPAPAPVDPLAEWAYSGTVQVGGRTMALVENTKTREGQYLGIGDTLAGLGATVKGIDERSVSLSVAGSDRTMFKTDDYKLTPLDKSAPYLTAGPQPGQPGAPSQPGQPNSAAGPAATGVPGAPGGAPFPGFDRLPPQVQQRIQERLNSMTPEQRAQMQNRWMNRRFEGRGGRRGGGFPGRGGGE